VEALAEEDATRVVYTQEWEMAYSAYQVTTHAACCLAATALTAFSLLFQPMSHLCLGLYTKDPATLAAHVSHYGGDMNKKTGEHLCLRTLPVSETPVRAELLEHFAGKFSFRPPNTVETLVRLPCCSLLLRPVAHAAAVPDVHG